MTQLLQADNLKKYFRTRGGLVRAVDGVSLTLERGETLALVGESGCGKSTLGRLLLHLLEADSGQVVFEGKTIAKGDLKRFRRRAQIVFQDPFRSLNPRRTVGDAIMEPLLVHRLARGDDAEARVIELLGEVGLEAQAMHRFPHEFSGGQRQRIGIARALAPQPDFLVLDEPVAALDVSVQAQIVRLLTDLQKRRGLGYVFISHNLGVVRHIAHRVAVMYCGTIVETAPVGELYRAPRHPYTRALLESIPEPDPARPLRATLGGDAPDAMNIAPGCRFHPRCRLARDIATPQTIVKNAIEAVATSGSSGMSTHVDANAANGTFDRAPRIPLVCARDEPALREIESNHFAACHFAEHLAAGEAR